MSDSPKTDVTMDEIEKAKLNLETAKIPWTDLQKYFASGSVLVVSPELDVVEVAHCMTVDNKAQLESWLNEQQVAPVSDKQAQLWFDKNSELWAVVVRPWVLVQDRD